MEGMSEAMAGELAPFNVKVTLVEPGPFRTDFAGHSLKNSKKKVAAYGNTPAGEWIRKFPERDGKQEGDPVKAVKLIMEVVESPNPPLRLPLGPVTYEGFKRKIESVQNDMAAWKDKNLKTSFDP